MKAVLISFMLSCVLALTYGDLDCSNYCKLNPCTTKIPIYSCRYPSVYRPDHAGKCGCCPACVILLSEGATCEAYNKELGQTPSSVCREPIRCYAGVCAKFPPRG